MDIEQITNETYDKVERLDRDLRKYMDDSNSSDLNDEKLDQINEKLDFISNSLGKTPEQKPFQIDPFKLDEVYVENTTDTTAYNTSDSIEWLNAFTMLNTNNRNQYFFLRFMSITCDDPTFNFQLFCDCEVEEDTKLYIEFANPEVGTVNILQKTYNLQVGRNIINETVTDITASELGNFVKVRFSKNNVKINSYKIEVFGKNIHILTKPDKYKVFSKWGKTLISKVENHNGYYLELDSSTLNPIDLEKDFVLAEENVIDFASIFGRYSFKALKYNSPICYAFLDKEGQLFHKVATTPTILVPIHTKGENLALQDNTSTTNFFRSYQISTDYTIVRITFGTNMVESTGFLSLGSTSDDSARTTTIIDNYDELVITDNNKAIFMKKNGMNVLYFKISSSATKLDLGKGIHLTAYWDKLSKNIMRVYMKINDKMVRKTIFFESTTADDGTVTESASIIEQKVIGTYDYYFETESNCYIVAKNDVLYMFKN